MKGTHWTDEAKWIWLANYDDTSVTGQVVLFRKMFHLQNKPKKPVLLRVSADTRYRLFVNNVSVSFGPCKSYLSRWYYDTIDISPHLREGHNIFHARVLRFSNAHAGSLSLIRAPSPGFILHCAIDVGLVVLHLTALADTDIGTDLAHHYDMGGQNGSIGGDDLAIRVELCTWTAIPRNE